MYVVIVFVQSLDLSMDLFPGAPAPSGSSYFFSCTN